MARIRSIHPDQPIDEDFVQCGPWARLLAIFVRNHADDNGIFEWKPIQLKIKIFPCDDVDVGALLDELVANNQVVSFEHDGRKYGAIRNFCRFQKPKKPNPIHFIPDELRTYVGLEPVSSEPIPHQDGSNGEKSPLMEKEGKSRGEEEKYKFCGSVVRLNAADYDRWRKQYSAIPDFDAELQRIDDHLAEKGEKKWFGACSAMLAAKHQKLAGERPKRNSGITPLGVGG